ncbi:MAG: hypothetical protein PCFJNLEI_01717 [Verrucomicrobiae bacterium]|nr:hypothetical protein [Verrucomicrobiae bacterium]
MRKVCVIQHIEIETPGRIADALSAAGYRIKTILSHTGQLVPASMAGFDGLVVMGGPQSVHEADKFPFLRHELRLIESALKAQKPILGVCLGSQLLAAALGARVYQGPQKEIGWYPVALTTDAGTDALLSGVPATFTPLHWHDDIFDLPAGAVALAASGLTAVQAYRYGANAYGFLCHLEVTDRHVAEWMTTFAEEVHQAGVDGRAILAGAKKHLPALHKIGTEIFGHWAALVRKEG